MSTTEIPAGNATSPKAMVVAGWVLTAVPVAMLVMSASMKLMQTEQVIEGFGKQGWPKGVELPIGIAELVSTLLYLIPQTAVLGAILVTGYLGGAIATHVRLGESILIPAALGVVVWLALFLRDARLRQLLPWRR